IPVLLPGVAEAPELPRFIGVISWVDMRDWEQDEGDSFYLFVCEILGKPPGDMTERRLRVGDVAGWGGTAPAELSAEVRKKAMRPAELLRRARLDKKWSTRQQALQALAEEWPTDGRTLPTIVAALALDQSAAVRQTALQLLAR